MTHTKPQLTLEQISARLKRCRGPFLGDGVNPGINAYETARLIDALLEENAKLKSWCNRCGKHHLNYSPVDVDKVSAEHSQQLADAIVNDILLGILKEQRA
jgi:hypothetical protein